MPKIIEIIMWFDKVIAKIKRVQFFSASQCINVIAHKKSPEVDHFGATNVHIVFTHFILNCLLVPCLDLNDFD